MITCETSKILPFFSTTLSNTGEIGSHGTSSTFMKHKNGKKLLMVISEWISLFCHTTVMEVSPDPQHNSSQSLVIKRTLMPYYMRRHIQAFITTCSNLVCVSFFPFDKEGHLIGNREPWKPTNHIIVYDVDTSHGTTFL